MLTPNHVPIPRLASEIAPLIDGPPPSYRTLADRVRDGLIPVEIINGRYFVLRCNLPTVVQALGLPLVADAPGAAVAA